MDENKQLSQDDIVVGPTDKWIDEIIRDTEHYFQGELQHDQRASWLLATNGLIIGIIVGFFATALENGYHLNVFLLGGCSFFLTLSVIASIMVILPMRGTKSIWSDMVGKAYRRDLRIGVDKLIEERFRHDHNWSDESYNTRIKYHFRSHYQRYTKKSRTVLLASIFLFISLVTTIALILDVYF